jgi:hypothetical protein
VKVRLYVEGGGDTRGSNLAIECRKAFSDLCAKAGLRRPAVIACGGRGEAYRQFCLALDKHQDAFNVLLVDSEAPVADIQRPWEHLKARDDWDRPSGVTDKHAQLMIQMMEAWLLADQEALKKVFGACLKAGRIPMWPALEDVSKDRLMSALKDATKDCKAAYGKGAHSFKVLAAVDPAKLRAACPSAERFFTTLQGES